MATKSITTYPDLQSAYADESMYKDEASLIDTMMRKHPILMHANVMQCNQGMSHKMSVLTGLPEAYFVKYYQGHTASAATRVIVDEGISLLKSTSIVDSDFLEALCGDDINKQRDMCMKEAAHNLEAMASKIEYNIFYGDKSKNPAEFTGLTPRFNHKHGSLSSNQIIDAGGNQNLNTSIWFVTWGNDKTSLLYPKDSMAGISSRFLPQQNVDTGAGKSFQGNRTIFTWQAGLAVADWRYVVRIAGIQIDDSTYSAFDPYLYMREAYYAHQSRHDKSEGTYIYCNSDIMQIMDRWNVNAISGDDHIRLRPGNELQGKEVKTYRDIPIIECPQIKRKESNLQGI
ncbi:hypothetical protein BJAS_P3964 [Bathymodiolus japonicus methanotrophic gill symbiont]|uniref:major capsid protein n=1 Tax=Bathymodiolus japonicus methanotrophic gill symbiont TaxID=113269 RepID=UPI001B707E59|nr:hypothetical protein [Bathymodiolus japonicus methanotrophic gill symbiont]GFO73252.1 hypothetical protein BJAS_P3964 [Bathymodiolus japonicus methanotrophic gill symbiont]